MPESTRNRHALCIGINDYPGTGADLFGCVNDALDWQSALTARGFRATTLLDSGATGAAIRAGIRELVGAAKWGDKVVITYSGHGTWVPDRDGDEADRRDEALCPYDVDTRGVIIDDELYALFTAKARGVRIVMISDSCNSGTVARFASFGTADATSRVRYLPPEAHLTTGQFAQARALAGRPRSKPQRDSALLLAGCRDFEYSYAARIAGRANGAFTRAALDTLVELPRAATFTDWHRSIARDLPSQRFPQTPQLYGSTTQRAWEVL